MPGLDALTDLSTTVAPTVSINGIDLLPTVQPKLKRTVVDTRLHLPDMFELTFEDSGNSVIEQTMVRIGSLVEIYGGASGSPQAECLIKGEVTSIEGEYHGLTIYTIIRGYEKAHRLQRASRTRSFVDMKDSDIASKIAREAGFTETDISDTSTTHRHVSQISQTDWDFLRLRAQEIGYETGVAQGKFFFREARALSRRAVRSEPLVARSPARPAASSAAGRRRSPSSRTCSGSGPGAARPTSPKTSRSASTTTSRPRSSSARRR